VIGSTFKGLIVGAIVVWYAMRVQSLAKGLVVGLLVSAIFAFIIAAIPQPTARTTGSRSWCLA
jgi:hypothetical protein